MDPDELRGLITAIAIGLLIGVVRERHALQSDAPHPGAPAAGLRTHAMVAIAAGVAAQIGMPALVATVLAVGALAVASYLRTREHDPGLTGEVALLVTALLAALAQTQTTVAAA